jgi:hypothetical protein
MMEALTQRTDRRGNQKDQEEKESWKESEKEQSSSSVMNPSQSLFKMEVKVDINPYQGEIDALKLNHWLQQLEVYFSIHHIDEEQKISFARLKLEGHALTWWEIHMETLRLEGDPPVTRWEDFKTLIKSQFYPIGYVEDQWIWWHYFRRGRGRVYRSTPLSSERWPSCWVSLPRTHMYSSSIWGVYTVIYESR